MKDILIAGRRLVKTPRFSLLFVLTLALGLGAVTTAFTLVQSVLLRPLPYKDPAALVRVLAFDRKESQVEWLTWAEAVALHEESEAFSDVAVSTVFPATLRTEEGTARLERGFVTHDYFGLIGVEPIVGGLFLEGDEQQILLSEGLWRTRWSGRTDVIGQSIDLDGELYTIAGVLPNTVYTHDLASAPAEVWIPQPLDRETSNPHFRIFTVVGRLSPGATLSQARGELETLQSRLATERPDVYEGWGAHADPLHASVIGDTGRGLVLLFAAVCLLLLIMSVNLANLMMSRFLERRREIATRLALGDSRTGILRDATFEGGLLAISGGALGAGLAIASLRLLPRLLPFALPRQGEIAADWGTLAIVLASALMATVFFAIVPALGMLAGNLSTALREGGRDNVGGGGRLRRSIIAAQLALSIPLLVGAGLLSQSLVRLSERSLGMQPNGLVTVRVSVPRAQYPGAVERVRFFRELLERVRAVPGVRSAGATLQVPFVAQQADRTRFRFMEEAERPADERPRALLQVVTEGYFETLGTRLVAGRTFDSRDDADGAPVMIVSQALVRRELGGREPLGLHIETEITMTPDEPNRRRIIGVVEDIPHFGPRSEPEPQIFVPHPQSAFGSMGIMLRTQLPVPTVVGETRKAAFELDPVSSVDEITTLREALDGTLGQPRFYSWLLVVFAVAATLLASLGLYGLLSFTVAARTRELGLRAALGATPSSLVSLVVRNGLSPALVGIGIGLALATVAVELVRSQLYDVRALDLPTFALSALLMLLFALATMLVPARRAAALDPMEALRGGD